MNKYWEDEQPLIVDTGRNVLRYFGKAGRLQVSMPNWLDKDGQQKAGKTVTLDLNAVRESPKAVKLFEQIAGVE